MSTALSVVLVLVACVVPLSSHTQTVDAAILVSGLDPTGRIAAGASHTCAISRDDTVWCWGDNTYGQLGNADFTLNGADTFSATPIQVDAAWGSRVPQQITAGYDHTCSLMTDGTVWCWGDNSFGQTSQTFGNKNEPTRDALPTSAIAISAGGNNTCVILSDHSVQCWGKNNKSQLGTGAADATAHYAPATVQLTDASSQSQFAVTFLDVGENHVCAGESNGNVRCWGQYNYGRLGTNTTQNASAPAGTAALGGTAKYVASGADHTCVVVTVGAQDTLSCFGHNNAGQIAQGVATTENSTPTTVALAHVPIQATAGQEFTCVLETANTVECFGANNFGQLGVNTSGASQYSPIAVSGIAGDVVDVVAGTSHACSVVATGEVWCWGKNDRGQLARSRATTYSYTPQVVTTINVVQTTTTIAPTSIAPTTETPTTETATTITSSTSTTTTTTSTTTSTTTTPVIQQNFASTTSPQPSSPQTSTTVPHKVSRTIRIGTSMSAAKIAAAVSLAIPKQSRGSMRIAITKGAKYCAFVGTTIKGLKRGTCMILVVLFPKSGNTTERKLTLTVK